MDILSTGFLKDYTVFNPNFNYDVIKFMDLQCTAEQVSHDIELADQNSPLSPEQIKSGELTLKERLNALIDRVEFIGHLDLVKNAAGASGYVLLGQEVTGIQWDIKALRLYLALTCIDIFFEHAKGTNHRSHFEASFSGAPETIKRSLLSLYKPDDTRKPDDTCKLKEIGLFFYNVRNYYTHSGKRFHIKEDIPIDQLTTFKSGSMKQKKEQQLFVAKDVKLVELIQSLALHVAKRRFGWA